MKTKPELLVQAEQRLDVIRPICHEGEILTAMLKKVKGKTRTPALHMSIENAIARMREIQPTCDEGAELVAMIEAGMHAVGFAAPVPATARKEFDAGAEGDVILVFPVVVRAVSFGVIEGLEAFDVLDIVFGRMSAIVSWNGIPSTLLGDIPTNSAKPEEGVIVPAGVPCRYTVRNKTKSRATFGVKVHVHVFDLSKAIGDNEIVVSDRPNV